MGSHESRCLNCFTSASAELPADPVADDSASYYGMPDSKFVPQSSTEDDMLRQIHEAQAKFSELLKIDLPSCDFEYAPDHPEYNIYFKDTPAGFTLVSQWTVPCAPQQFVEFLTRVELRTAWDKTIELAQKVRDVSDSVSLYRQVYKRTVMKTDREVLFLSKVEKQGSNWLNVCTSYTDAADQATVRIAVGGFFVEPAGEHAKVTNIVDTAFAGAVPKAMLRELSVSHVPTYVEALLQALQRFQSGKLT